MITQMILLDVCTFNATHTCVCLFMQVDDEMIFMQTAEPAIDALLSSPGLTRRRRGMLLPPASDDQPAEPQPRASPGMDAYMLM